MKANGNEIDFISYSLTVKELCFPTMNSIYQSIIILNNSETKRSLTAARIEANKMNEI